MSLILSIDNGVKGSTAKVVIGNIGSSKVCFFVLKAVGQDFARKSVADLFIIINVGIDDQGAVCRDTLCKLAERMSARSLKKSM